ncbi:uncharacterized protein N7484_008205 [Penicillium longicatenatum]|uniref:uncharacterized protein n=1 Tax=Penicillium longicatenatum TaxID=1561947 RepID=UPI0025486D14|nr:uncharacterized protein N7484_008205 [Penicillium longicatenatum]KAJ5640343.1 hypothetical protein N7484_008205 [Penicillium longicatenatum]
MANPAYFDSVTSISYFKNRFITEGGKLFSEISNVAASAWCRDHLFACQVIRRDTQYDMRSFPDIHAFLKGPDSTYSSQSEHGLVRDSGYSLSLAQIWAAMAMIKAGKNLRMDNSEDFSVYESDDEPDSRAKRLRRNTLQEGYVDSSVLQVGSSSPKAESIHTASSLDWVDRATHILLSSPEDETLRLASCVIRHILYYAPPQDTGGLETVIEFRDAKRRLTAITPVLRRKIVAIDDGGLYRRKANGNIFTVDKERVAIVEAKREFQCLENGRPTISDNCLAQMTREALVSRLADPFTELGEGR